MSLVPHSERVSRAQAAAQSGHLIAAAMPRGVQCGHKRKGEPGASERVIVSPDAHHRQATSRLRLSAHQRDTRLAFHLRSIEVGSRIKDGYARGKENPGG